MTTGPICWRFLYDEIRWDGSLLIGKSLFYRYPLQNGELFVPVKARLRYFTAFLGGNTNNLERRLRATLIFRTEQV
jgi:hypothetical protein